MTTPITGRTREKYSPVRFTGYEPCKEEWRGAKLIFVTGGASTGGIGTNLKDAVVVRLNPTFDANAAVHEFGHVLGFGHGSRRIETQSWCVKDEGGAQPRHVKRELTGWDPKSVMSYCTCITDPALDRDSDPAFAPTGWDGRTCHSNRPVSLSVADVIGLQAVYGKPEGWALGANEDGDQFGGAMTPGDFNGDGDTDLAIGTPGESPGAAQLDGPRSGQVIVYRMPRPALNAWYGLNQQGPVSARD